MSKANSARKTNKTSSAKPRKREPAPIGQVILKQWSGSDFPLHCNYQVIPKGHIYSPHTHDGIELVFITKGSGIEYIAELSYPIIAGDLYVIDVGSVHAFTVESDLEFYNLIFQPELFSKEEMSELAAIPHFHSFFLPKKRETQAKLAILPAVQERINTLFSRLTRELAARRPGYKLLVKSLFFDLVITIGRFYREREDPSSRVDGTVARALGYIHEHYHEAVSVDGLAELTGLSPGHFGEIFKEKTGTKVLEYLNRVRVDRARSLLEGSNQSITEIARDCGFDDVGYFARVFRRVTGKTPREHRREAGGNP